MDILEWNCETNSSDITQDVLKELFDYREDGVFVRKKAVGTGGNFRDVGAVVEGNVKIIGYRDISINGRKYQLHRMIYLWHHGKLPEVVDHIDNDPSNNRIENLRASTFKRNSRNRTSHRNSSSQYLGVSYNKNRNKWTASLAGKYIGSFNTEEEAARAYNKKAKKEFGVDANPNKI